MNETPRDTAGSDPEPATAGDGPATAETARYRVIIRAPIHKVWAELTRTGSVLPFFFNGVCRTPGLAVGAPMRMQSKDGKNTSVAGEVLEFDPPHRYAHSFKFTNLDDPPCVVRYELKEVAEGTEFTLITENVPAGTKTEKYMISGGDFITKNLKAFVETGKATPGGRFALFVMGLFAPFTPKQSRSEHWPFERRI
jgi:uncharacterized protein YndB with AHSA1/START domain